MRIAIYSRKFKIKDAPYIKTLFEVIDKMAIEAHVYSPYYEALQDTIPHLQEVSTFEKHEDIAKTNIDFFVTLGGDGTILDAAIFVRHYQIPIVGINLGRLGFLASVSKKQIYQTFQLLEKGHFSLDKRSLLHLECSEDIFEGESFALNDFTLLKRDTSSMITIHTYINGAFLNSYWADGLIVATPTGSTGYSLSCGGPIIFPNSGNFVITPVAPHNLNVRPVVISDDSVISFEVEGRADNYLCTLDSRFRAITSDYELAVRKADFCTQLVRLPDREFLWTIREKLAWGLDARN